MEKKCVTVNTLKSLVMARKRKSGLNRKLCNAIFGKQDGRQLTTKKRRTLMTNQNYD